ncbi:hypothetical protein CPB83DRAFT_857095 [Crepidotus variabilis]|uniref:Uncharacterized protein n=1 Tax=Crepidotus variabilis TaxID=179855 RepID=A0A9P6EDB4_9AGAR|nr:hypothetical protein CPB83DRAFT_857095 [Crepidotus variabilis]
MACLPTIENLILRGVAEFPFAMLDKVKNSNLKRIELLGDHIFNLVNLEKAPNYSKASGLRHFTLHDCWLVEEVASWFDSGNRLGSPWISHLQSFNFCDASYEGLELFSRILKVCEIV